MLSSVCQSDQVNAEGHDGKAVPGILDCGVCSARASTRHLTRETALTLRSTRLVGGDELVP